MIYLLSKQVTEMYLSSGFSADVSGFWNAENMATLTLMLPLFFFGELFPKNLFRLHADQLMYRCSEVIRIIQWVFIPFTYSLKGIFQDGNHGSRLCK